LDFPFYDIARSVFENAPQVIWNPGLGVRFAFYWAMAFFVFSQYRKTAAMQAHLYGKPRRDPLTATLVSALEGLGAGIVGSFVMTFFGVSFLPDGGGLIWVLGTALVLMAVNPRLMCFSYAGGLVSLSYLLFGFPVVSVPALMGLVAVLHLMESLLIFFTGAAGAKCSRSIHAPSAVSTSLPWPPSGKRRSTAASAVKPGNIATPRAGAAARDHARP